MGALLFERGVKQVWLASLAEPTRLALPFKAEPYVCMLWANQAAPGPEQRMLLTDELISSGCRYVVCGGQECEVWHDSADESYLAVDPDCTNRDAFVTTTWHEGESEKDVIFFFLACTRVENVSVKRYLIVQLGRNEEQARTFGRLVKSLCLAEWAA